MRKYIGNITIVKSERVEESSIREKFRLDLVKEWKSKSVKNYTVKHLKKMSGEYDSTNEILFFFSQEGKPPPNISMNGLITQYEQLISKHKWIKAIEKELRLKLKNINIERYQEDEAIKAKWQAKLMDKKDESYNRYIEDEEQVLKPYVLEVLREAIHKSNRANELKRADKRSHEDMHILTVRQIEKALRYVFNDYTHNNMCDIVDNPDMQYNVIKDDVDTLEVLSADMNNNIHSIRELIESGLAYLEVES